MNGRRTGVNARAPKQHRSPLRRTRGISCAGGIAVVMLALADPALAQAGMTHVEDAMTVPRGLVRLRVIPSWSRFERRFAGESESPETTVPLANVLAADSLGVQQIPALAASEAAIQTLSGDPTLRLSLGQSASTATARVVTTAIAVELGLTRRLTLGAVLPIVQTRTELFVGLNANGSSHANVGPNPGRAPQSGAQTQALQLQNQLATVRQTLQSRLTACEANPGSDPSCPNLLANRADVVALIAETSAFQSAVGVVFGATSGAAGQPFAPLAGTTAASAIDARLTTLTDRLRGYVGGAADQIVARVPFAAGPAGFADLQRLLLESEFGLAPDSLGAVYRFNVGDVELGAKLLLLERAAATNLDSIAVSDRRRLSARLAVAGVVRLGTGQPTLERLPNRYLEYGTGDGQTDLELRTYLDLGIGPHFAVLSQARYTWQLGEVDAGRIPADDGIVNPFVPLLSGTRRLGDIFVGEITPRLLLGRFLGVDAHYAIIVRGDDEYTTPDPGSGGAPLLRGGFTEQRVGVGLSYSTLRGARGRRPRLPVEISIAHIETIAGSNALVPRAARQQIGLRLYYQVYR